MASTYKVNGRLKIKRRQATSTKIQISTQPYMSYGQSTYYLLRMWRSLCICLISKYAPVFSSFTKDMLERAERRISWLFKLFYSETFLWKHRGTTLKIIMMIFWVYIVFYLRFAYLNNALHLEQPPGLIGDKFGKRFIIYGMHSTLETTRCKHSETKYLYNKFLFDKTQAN